VWVTGLAAAVLVVAAFVVARIASATAKWPPAGGLLLLALSPTVPNVPVTFGLSLDDVLPIVASLCLLPASFVIERARRRWRVSSRRRFAGLPCSGRGARPRPGSGRDIQHCERLGPGGTRSASLHAEAFAFLLMAAIVVVAVLANHPGGA